MEKDEFVNAMKAFCDKWGLKPSRFGRMVANYGMFIADVESGKRSPTLKTIEHVTSYMRNYDPK